MAELIYVAVPFSAMFLVGYWIHVGESQLKRWHVFSESATLRDRLIAHEVSISVFYEYGVPVDQLDLLMPDGCNCDTI